jgi:hypothetical protein
VIGTWARVRSAHNRPLLTGSSEKLLTWSALQSCFGQDQRRCLPRSCRSALNERRFARTRECSRIVLADLTTVALVEIQNRAILARWGEARRSSAATRGDGKVPPMGPNNIARSVRHSLKRSGGALGGSLH